jgi:D-glycero-alpha-D-manno-heptose 1-phosphate guanylyltransferase
MTTCILLAGGLGTRLREALPGVPKCLAPVAGTPFVQIQIERLASQGVERFVLSLGHLAEQVIEVAERLRKTFRVDWVVEPRPLGTGGAALFAMHHAALSEALVANADTFIEGDISALLSPLNGAEQIRMCMAEPFLPGGAPGPRLVSAGIYRVHRKAFGNYRPGEAFSLESDVIETLAGEGKVAAVVLERPFADIGVPRDYFRFCEQWRARA